MHSASIKGGAREHLKIFTSFMSWDPVSLQLKKIHIFQVQCEPRGPSRVLFVDIMYFQPSMKRELDF